MRRIILILLLLLLPVVALAHPGGTDENGGHYNRSTGEYHYHHGYPEHQHPNGKCPYNYNDKTGSTSGSSSGSGASSNISSAVSSRPTPTPKPSPKPTASPAATPKIAISGTYSASKRGEFSLSDLIPNLSNLLWFAAGLLVGLFFLVRTKRKLQSKLDELTSMRSAEKADHTKKEAALETSLSSTHAEKTNLVKEVAALKISLAGANAENAKHAKQIATLKASLAGADADNAKLVDEITALYASLAKADAWKDKYDNDICAILSSWQKDAARRTEDLECLKRVYDETIERRRDEQFELLKDLISRAGNAPVAPAIEAALQLPVPPDTSKGIVFISHDLSSRVYHHSENCTFGLVPASRVFAERSEFVPCECCSQHSPPMPDHVVYISSPRAKAYHKYICYHLSASPASREDLFVSTALEKGLKPCSACHPPARPKYKLLF